MSIQKLDYEGRKEFKIKTYKGLENLEEKESGKAERNRR